MMFRNEYWFLSNMYPIDLKVDGVLYHSSENYYQSHKTTSHCARNLIAGVSPRNSKKLGRRVTLRCDWNDVKINVMKDSLYYKFSLSNELRDKLIATGETELIEDNTWNDRYWGVCNGEGNNHLGKLLMELRDELKSSKIMKSIMYECPNCWYYVFHPGTCPNCGRTLVRSPIEKGVRS